MYYIDENLALSPKLIFSFLILYACILPLGYILHNFIVIVPVSIFIYLLFKRNYNNIVLFTIFWSFVYNYYIGQRNITNPFLITYLLKSNTYIIITLLLSLNRFHGGLFRKIRMYMYWSVVFIITVILSNAYNGTSFLNAIAYPTNLYVFILLLSCDYITSFNNKLLNLVVSIVILQLVLSILQVSDIIPRPIFTLYENVYKLPGLDDVASGSMGAGSSVITSWLGTILFLFFYTFAIQIRRIPLALFSFIFLAQYVTVDSKIALGVTILGVLFSALKSNINLSFSDKRGVILLSTILFGFLFYRSVDYYYSNYLARSAGAPTDRAENSFNLVRDNFNEWGKIAGFGYLTEEYLQTDPVRIVLGYGQGNFSPDHLYSRDTPTMQADNSLRSKSSFIKIYGEFGAIGLFFFTSFLLFIRKDIKRIAFSTSIGRSYRISGVIILDSTLVIMFLGPGSITITDKSVLLVLIIYALILRHEYATTNNPHPARVLG